MSDLISRQQAIDALGEEPEVWSNDNEYELGMRNQWLYDREMIKSLPSAQPERKNGKWIDGQCSICGCDIPAYIIDWKWQKDMDAKYCPRCGSRMEGESE